MLNCGGVIILLSQFEGRKIPCISVAGGVGTPEHTGTRSTQQKTSPFFTAHVLELVPAILCKGGDKILTMSTLRKRKSSYKRCFPWSH